MHGAAVRHNDHDHLLALRTVLPVSAFPVISIVSTVPNPPQRSHQLPGNGSHPSLDVALLDVLEQIVPCNAHLGPPRELLSLNIRHSLGQLIPGQAAGCSRLFRMPWPTHCRRTAMHD